MFSISLQPVINLSLTTHLALLNQPQINNIIQYNELVCLISLQFLAKHALGSRDSYSSNKIQFKIKSYNIIQYNDVSKFSISLQPVTNLILTTHRPKINNINNQIN